MKQFILLLVLSGAVALGGDYVTDYAALKKKVSAGKMESYLTAWRKRQANNPDAYIHSFNWRLEQSMKEPFDFGGLGPPQTKAWVTKEIDGELYLVDPDTGKVQGKMNSAIIYDEKGVRSAIGILEEARQRFPHRLDIHLGIASTFRRIKAYDEDLDALKIMMLAARANAGKLRWCHEEKLPESEECYLAQMLHEIALQAYREETEAGNQRFGKIVQLMVEELPGQVLSWNDLAADREMAQDWKAVHKALERAIAIAPRDSIVVFNLGRSNRRLGFRDAAEMRFKEVIELNDNPDIVEKAQNELAKLRADR